MKRKTYPWVYRPGLMDTCDPTVIKGTAIAPGSRVRIARDLFPPMLPKCFVLIEDKTGNVQSVWQIALVSVASEAKTRAAMEDFNYVGSKYHY